MAARASERARATRCRPSRQREEWIWCSTCGVDTHRSSQRASSLLTDTGRGGSNEDVTSTDLRRVGGPFR
jgi:hypothetical protein